MAQEEKNTLIALQNSADSTQNAIDDFSCDKLFFVIYKESVDSLSVIHSNEGPSLSWRACFHQFIQSIN